MEIFWLCGKYRGRIAKMAFCLSEEIAKKQIGHRIETVRITHVERETIEHTSFGKCGMEISDPECDGVFYTYNCDTCTTITEGEHGYHRCKECPDFKSVLFPLKEDQKIVVYE